MFDLPGIFARGTSTWWAAAQGAWRWLTRWERELVFFIITITIITVGEGEKGRRREGGKAEEGFGRSKETVEGSRGAGGLQPGEGGGRGGGQRGKKSGRGEGPSYPLSLSF